MNPLLQQDIFEINESEKLYQQAKESQAYRAQMQQHRAKLSLNMENPLEENIPTPTAAPPTDPKAQKANEVMEGVKSSLTPIKQHTDIGCGQASAAAAINSLENKKMTSQEFEQKYGFNLLSGLNQESEMHSWRDAGDFAPTMWDEIEKKSKQGIPTIIGLNGPEFSPSGRGHIVAIDRVEGDTVSYMDPADGSKRTTTRKAVEQAPAHPDGKFVFSATPKEGKQKPVENINNIKYKPQEHLEDAFIGVIGEEYGLDPALFHRTLLAESNLDPTARSEAGAMGLGQLMPDTWEKEVLPEMKQLGLIDPNTKAKDYDDNYTLQAKASAYYLKKMVDKYDGNYSRGLAAYNMGAGALDAVLAEGGSIYPETKAYVGKIFNMPASDAESHILTGVDPFKPSVPKGVPGLVPGKPQDAILKLATGNENVVKQLNEKATLDDTLKFLGDLNPEFTARIIDSVKDSKAAFDTRSLIAKEATNYDGFELAKSMAKKALNTFTMGISEYLGAGATQRDMDVLEAAGDEGGMAWKGFVNIGPALTGELASLASGSFLFKKGAKFVGKAALKGIGKEAAENSTSRTVNTIRKMATDPNFISSSSVGRAMAMSSSKGLAGNLGSGVLQGMVLGFPAAMGEASWERQRAALAGLSPEEQASAAKAAFIHTMGASAAVSVLLPGIGVTAAGAAVYGPKVAASVGRAGMKKADEVLGTGLEAFYDGMKAYSWRGMDKAKQLPFLRGVHAAVTGMADAGRRSFTNTFNGMLDVFEAEGRTALAREAINGQRSALAAGKQLAVASKSAQHSIIDSAEQGLQKIQQMQQQADALKEKLLGAEGLDPSHLGAVMAPDATMNVAKNAQAVDLIRNEIKGSFVNQQGQPAFMEPIERAIADFKDSGLTASDVITLTRNYTNKARQARSLEIISEDEFGLIEQAGKALSEKASALPPPQGGKKGQHEGVKRFLEDQEKILNQPFENYKEITNIANKLNDTSPEQLVKLDALRNRLKKEKHGVLNKALSDLYKYDGEVGDLRKAFEGGLDFVNKETGANVLRNHVKHQDEALDDLIQTYDKLDAHLAAKYGNLDNLSPQDLDLITKGDVDLSKVLSMGDQETLEKVLDGSLKLSANIRPERELAMVRNALDERLSNIRTDAGMVYNQFDRHDETLKTVKRALAGKKDFLETTSTSLKSVVESMEALGMPKNEITAITDQLSSATKDVFKKYQQIATDARTILRRDLPRSSQPGILNSEITKLQRAQELIDSGNVEKANAAYQALITNKGIREILNEPRVVSQAFEEMNETLANRVMNAKSPADLTKIYEDLSNAANMQSNTGLETYFDKLETGAEKHLRALQKSLNKPSGDKTAINTIIQDSFQNADALEETGSKLADLYLTRMKEFYPRASSKVMERLAKDAPTLEFTADGLQREFTLAIHDVLSGAKPTSLDNLIQKGVTRNGVSSGPIPELAEVLAPIKRLAEYVSKSPGKDEIFDLMHYYRGELIPQFSRLEQIKTVRAIQPDSEFRKILTNIERGRGGKEQTLFDVKGGRVMGTKKSETPYTLRDATKDAHFAEEALARAYKTQHGKDMPDDYWKQILMRDNPFEPEFLKTKFIPPNGQAPYPPDQLKKMAASLAFKQIQTTPEQLVGGFVKSVTSADSARHLLNNLSEIKVPGTNTPFIIKKGEAGVPTGAMQDATGTINSEYRPLTTDDGQKLPLRNLNIEGVKTGAEDILVHPQLHKLLSTHFTKQGPIKQHFAESLSDFYKHAVLVGSPMYFMSIMSGQLLKESRYSLSKALGMVVSGRRAIQTNNHEVQAAALDAGLNFAQFTKMMGMQTHTVSKQAANHINKVLGGADQAIQGLDKAINEPVFEAIREAQLGAWQFKSREYFEDVGRTLMKEGGYTYQEAMRESQRLAAKHINKTFGTMHRTVMSDSGSRFFRMLSLANGLNQGRLASMTDVYNGAVDTALRAVGKSRNQKTLNMGVVDPAMRKKYDKEAMAAAGIGITMAAVYTNALSMMINNGASTLHNKPGKEDSVRIGDNYFKLGLFGFDNLARSLMRVTPGPKQAIEFAKEAVGDDRELNLNPLQKAGFAVQGVSNPALQTMIEGYGNKTIEGDPIWEQHAGLGSNLQRAAAWNADQIPALKIAKGGSWMTGKPMTGGEKLAEAGFGYTSPSPVSREEAQYVNQLSTSLQTSLRENIEVKMIEAYHTEDEKEKDKLLEEAINIHINGIKLPPKQARILGTDTMRLSNQAYKNLYAEIILQNPANDFKKVRRQGRAHVMERTEQLNPTYDAGFLGERY